MSADSTTPSGAPSEPKKRPWWVYLLIVLGLCPVLAMCVGIGAAVAIPSFVRFVKSSKTSEATSLLGAMRQGTVSYCTRAGHLPEPDGPCPEGAPGANKQAADVTRHPSLSAIGFAPTTPLYYRYSIEAEEGGIRLRAVGDLDGDGVLSERTIRCASNCECGAIEVLNELE